ncbi:MAG TPA: nitrogen fixation protein NifM [Hyphomicrobiales bacterium]|nr:nitrogen fixation protein NifM [Kaistiaceae bacterium]HQF32041.1 nitrogen fixation protein NifM [Hyphomicrobiales bacterium]
MSGVLAHHRLRAALSLFGRRFAELGLDERAAAEAEARRSIDIEARVLASPEAAGIVIPDRTLEETIEDVRSRYDSPEDFAADMAGNGLDEADLVVALARELKVEAVLEKVAASVPTPTEEQVRGWYDRHPEKFDLPEIRLASHILVTVNAAIPENSRERAQARITALRAGMGGNLAEFRALAGRHSECPSALDGGRLGRIARGQLYPTLDAALFAMDEGEISPPLESELGFHLVLCETIFPAAVVPFETARSRIRDAMEKTRRKTRQVAWLAELMKRAPGIARATDPDPTGMEASHA